MSVHSSFSSDKSSYITGQNIIVDGVNYNLRYMENNLIKWCKNCMNMSTRPRITLMRGAGAMHASGWRKKKSLIGSLDRIH